MKKLAFILTALFTIYDIFAWDLSIDTKGTGKADRFLNVEASKKWENLDLNRNKIPDENCFYVSEKKIVYQILEEEQDYDGNGKSDIWIKYSYTKYGFSREIAIDTNGDGTADFITYEKNNFVYQKKYALDFDGNFESIEEFTKKDSYARKDFVDGRQVNVRYDVIEIKKSEDTNLDGKMDSFFWTEEHYHGKQMVAQKPMREEFDKNFDGKIDIWMEVTYGPDGHMQSVVTKYDNNFNGKVDEWRYANQRGEVYKQEFDYDSDGRVDEVRNNPRDLKPSKQFK